MPADASAKTAARTAAQRPRTTPHAQKPRIDYIDGCCFALVFPIVIAHFARFGTSSRTLLKLLTQENVLVGGFFVIYGYVAAYAFTRLGEVGSDERKFAKPELFFWQRVMSYYPLHLLVSTAFAPMFLAAERWRETPWPRRAFRAFLNYSMLQAWFPKEAMIWNQPAWFLSALTFANFTMPAILPRVARLSKKGLRKVFCAMSAVSVLHKVSYSESSQFHSLELAGAPQQSPLLWNLTRFHPFWALLEMTMGMVAARDVMLDTGDDSKRLRASPLLYFAAAYSSLLLRLTSFDFNDAIIRSCLFVPLYTKFLKAVHRDCLADTPSAITRLLSAKRMTHLGSLTFSMFILHGPVGQLFYKREVAHRLWGRTMPPIFFPVYLAVVLISSHVMNEIMVKSRAVQFRANKVAHWLSDRTEGMLQDR